jgi:hypothetical protein
MLMWGAMPGNMCVESNDAAGTRRYWCTLLYTLGTHLLICVDLMQRAACLGGDDRLVRCLARTTTIHRCALYCTDSTTTNDPICIACMLLCPRVASLQNTSIAGIAIAIALPHSFCCLRDVSYTCNVACPSGTLGQCTHTHTHPTLWLAKIHGGTLRG